jgi:hypothetical protein
MPTGAWFDPAEDGTLERHGNPNILTLDKGSSKLAQALLPTPASLRSSGLRASRQSTAPSIPRYCCGRDAPGVSSGGYACLRADTWNEAR